MRNCFRGWSISRAGAKAYDLNFTVDAEEADRLEFVAAR